MGQRELGRAARRKRGVSPKYYIHEYFDGRVRARALTRMKLYLSEARRMHPQARGCESMTIDTT